MLCRRFALSVCVYYFPQSAPGLELCLVFFLILDTDISHVKFYSPEGGGMGKKWFDYLFFFLREKMSPRRVDVGQQGLAQWVKICPSKKCIIFEKNKPQESPYAICSRLQVSKTKFYKVLSKKNKKKAFVAEATAPAWHGTLSGP